MSAAAQQVEGRFQGHLEEIGDVCSFILYYAYPNLLALIDSKEAAKELLREAMKTQRGFGMYLQVVFNRSWLDPKVPTEQILRGAGFTKLIEYPAAHDPEDTVLVYGAPTGQRPH